MACVEDERLPALERVLERLGKAVVPTFSQPARRQRGGQLFAGVVEIEMLRCQNANIRVVVLNLVAAEVLRVGGEWAAAEQGSGDAEGEERSSHGAPLRFFAERDRCDGPRFMTRGRRAQSLLLKFGGRYITRREDGQRKDGDLTGPTASPATCPSSRRRRRPTTSCRGSGIRSR